MKKVFIGLAAALFLAGAGCTAPGEANNQPTSTPQPVVCTMDAKQCPDGSYVGRTGPNCEFTPCPETKTSSTANTNGEEIIKKVGEREGSFLIQKINTDSVNGLWYQKYPIAKLEGVPKTLHIGDDIGYACEGVSEKLVSINFSAQIITFNKIVSLPPRGGCPL